MLPSELQYPVQVTSLNWVRKSTGVAHLLVSFLHHHVEYDSLDSSDLTPGVVTENCRGRIVDGATKNVISHVAIHTPVSVLTFNVHPEPHLTSI